MASESSAIRQVLMFCSECGTQTKPGEKFCAECGRPLATGTTPPTIKAGPRSPAPVVAGTEVVVTPSGGKQALGSNNEASGTKPAKSYLKFLIGLLIAIIVLPFIGIALWATLLAFSPPDPRVEISRAQYGTAWPFTVYEGTLVCIPVGPLSEVIFEANGKRYALNGTAMYASKYADIEEIWATPKVPLSAIIDRGLALRNGPERNEQTNRPPPRNDKEIYKAFCRAEVQAADEADAGSPVERINARGLGKNLRAFDSLMQKKYSEVRARYGLTEEQGQAILDRGFENEWPME